MKMIGRSLKNTVRVKDRAESAAAMETGFYSCVGNCNYGSQKNTRRQEMELEK